ncbi:concanavalin A-like lectin/glucanase superfamily protein [Oryzihumus leptocrescens]|uniref:Concanavalin A-like lectin/glucanase superfamily protein n=2 Tax=Oryzihumus leptocrescens TaxID=297536 RepID=A0A542ZF19_9MICO|nr:concanavalin A-like lectin/glucanase superfamily protein [Oryzihumus leptocrescens]
MTPRIPSRDRHTRKPRAARAHTSLAAVVTGLLTTASLAVAAPADAARAPSAGTVVGLWHMDEAPGAGTMVDSSGLGHNGTISTGVTTGTPSDDGTTGYTFTQTGGVVRVPNDSTLNPGTSPLTLSIHLRMAANVPAGDYNVVEKGTATATGGAYKLEINATHTGPKFGFPDCAFNGATGSHAKAFAPASILDGKWHVVTCHLNTTQAWVELDGHSGKTVAWQGDSIANSADLTIGAKPNATHGYVGDADEATLVIG